MSYGSTGARTQAARRRHICLQHSHPLQAVSYIWHVSPRQLHIVISERQIGQSPMTRSSCDQLEHVAESSGIVFLSIPFVGRRTWERKCNWRDIDSWLLKQEKCRDTSSPSSHHTLLVDIVQHDHSIDQQYQGRGRMRDDQRYQGRGRMREAPSSSSFSSGLPARSSTSLLENGDFEDDFGQVDREARRGSNYNCLNPPL